MTKTKVMLMANIEPAGRKKGPKEVRNPAPSRLFKFCDEGCYLNSHKPRAAYCGDCIAIYKRKFKKVRKTSERLSR